MRVLSRCTSRFLCFFLSGIPFKNSISLLSVWKHKQTTVFILVLLIYILQVTNWDANKRVDTEKENLVSPTPFTQRTGQAPFTGFAVSNLQSFEFDVENYLGSAYWEATKFLDRLQQVS